MLNFVLSQKIIREISANQDDYLLKLSLLKNLYQTEFINRGTSVNKLQVTSHGYIT